MVFYDGTNADQDPYLTKEQFIDLVLEKAREADRKADGNGILSPEIKKKLMDVAAKTYDAGVEKEGRTPRLSDVSINLKVTQEESYVEADLSRLGYYKGPQTVEALMARFDKINRHQGSKEDIFPRAEWIQRALNLGVEFRDNLDYSGILAVRDVVLNDRKRLEILQDEARFNEHINRRILWKANDNIAFREMIRKNPRSTGGINMGGRYIPTQSNQVHLKITPGDPSHGVVQYGPRERKLTEREKRNLYYHGIAPKGIEVIYLDENNEPLPPGSDPITLK